MLVNRIANIIRFGSAHGSKELARPVTEQDLNDLRTAVAIGRDLPRETAYLAVRPARPWNVPAITFTNKAAGELKERLRAMLGETLGGDVFASTFHSACVRFLRRDAERIGFPKSFTIYDSDDQQRVIKQIYKDLMIDDKFLPVKSAVSQISSFKDKLHLGRGYCLREAPCEHQGGAHLQDLHHLRRPAENGGRDGLRRPDLPHRQAAAKR